MLLHHIRRQRGRSLELGRRVLCNSWSYPLWQRRAWRNNPVTVLMYHTLGLDDDEFDAWTVVRMRDFEAQVRTLRTHYRIVSLDEALARPPQATPDRPMAVITFDDGHTGLHQHLLPYVEREHLPVTVYISTSHVAAATPYWFDRVMNATQTREPCVIELRTFGLGRYAVNPLAGADNWSQVGRLLEDIKRHHASVRPLVCDEIERQTAGVRRVPREPLEPLTIAQVRDLANSRWITIGSHTHGHELLDQVGLSDARMSILKSCELLRSWTGQQIRHFAYPNGNHNANLIDLVRRLGLTSASTTHHGLWDPSTGPWTISRVPVARFDSLARFKLNLVRHADRPQYHDIQPSSQTV